MPPVPPLPVNYSNLGDVRFGRFFWVIALFLISSHGHVRAAQSVRLAWNASPSSGVTVYRVYHRISSGTQSTSVDAGNVLTATISVSVMRRRMCSGFVHTTVPGRAPGLMKSHTRPRRRPHKQKRIILRSLMGPLRAESQEPIRFMIF
jgi:hypothetical protein